MPVEPKKFYPAVFEYSRNEDVESDLINILLQQYGSFLRIREGDCYTYDHYRDNFTNTVPMLPSNYQLIDIKEALFEIRFFPLAYPRGTNFNNVTPEELKDPTWGFGFAQKGTFTLIEDSYIFSQWGEALVKECWNDAINLTYEDHISLHLPQFLRDKREPYSSATNPKYERLTHLPLQLDSSGSFSCIDPTEALKTSVLQTNDLDKDISCFLLNNLYRGGATEEVGLEKTTLKVAQLFAAVNTVIFPYKTKWKFFDIPTMEWKEEKVFCFGIFEPLDKILKYTRSREFTIDFINNMLSSKGKFYSDHETYLAEKAMIFREHTKFWKGISNLFPTLSIDNPVKEVEGARKVIINPMDISALSAGAELQSRKEVKELQKIRKAQGEVEKKLAIVKVDIEDNKYSTQERLESISRYKDALKAAEQQLALNETHLTKLLEKQKGYKPAHQKLQAELKEKKAGFDKALFEILNKDSSEDRSNNFITNIAKAGIIVTDIVYMEKTTGTLSSLSEDPSIGLQAKLDSKGSGYSLNKVEFYTDRPIVIKIDAGRDGEDCKKAVGGPYRASCTREGGLLLSLLSTNSCFGVLRKESNSYFWLHPHTPSKHISISDWETFSTALLSIKAAACLGEAETSWYHAWDTNDPKALIMSALTWLSNANSADQWGKYWVHFPRFEETVLGQPESAKVESTIESVTSSAILLEMIEDAEERLDDYEDPEQDEEYEDEEEYDEEGNWIEPSPETETPEPVGTPARTYTWAIPQNQTYTTTGATNYQPIYNPITNEEG